MGLKSIPRGSKSNAPETVAPGPAAGQTPDTSALTVRERDVMALLSRGRTNKDISATLGISACTVAVHVKRIYRKLKVRSRKELATAIAPLHYRRASRHTNAESYVMALDQGTTSSRAIIFDRHGGVKAIAQKEFEPQMPGARVTELRKGWRRALRAAEAWAE